MAKVVATASGVYVSGVLLTYCLIRFSANDPYLANHNNGTDNNTTTVDSDRPNPSSTHHSRSGTCGGCHCRGCTTPPQFDPLIASTYDTRIHWDEFLLGILLLRRCLLRHAKGDVLEVGTGTGRNLPYYHIHNHKNQKNKVKRLVLTDHSAEMLQQAQTKVQQYHQQTQQNCDNHHKDPTTTQPQQQQQQQHAAARIVTVHADAHALPFPEALFDTVVDTFGLCSYDHPVRALQEMVRVCKPGGHILLLEHGRSQTWEFVSTHLDRTAAQHAAQWGGCVWNRDLDAILQQSAVPIQSLHTWHLGTTYYVVCRKPPIIAESS